MFKNSGVGGSEYNYSLAKILVYVLGAKTSLKFGRKVNTISHWPKFSYMYVSKNFLKIRGREREHNFSLVKILLYVSWANMNIH